MQYTESLPRDMCLFANRTFLLCLCIFVVLPGLIRAEGSDSTQTESGGTSTDKTRQQWFRHSDDKIFNGLTSPEKLNKRIETQRPARHNSVPDAPIPLSAGKEVWSCADCSWIRTTDAFSRESEKKLRNDTFHCPRCDGTNVRRMPRTQAALQFKAISENLVPNNSFERGRWWPYLWEPVDGLGTFWAKGGTDGEKCMKFNTDLIESQWLPYHSRILKSIRQLQEETHGKAQEQETNPLPTPPDPEATSAPYYDTVAGLHGIHYKGPFIPVEPGAIYRITVDARVDERGGAKVFVKGFVDQSFKTRDGNRIIKRNAYRAPMNLDGLGREWKRFSRIFHPARSKSTIDDRSIQPEWLQIQLYSYWPPDTYWWDNVKLEIIGYEKLPDHGNKSENSSQKAEPAETKDGFPIY